MQHLLFRLTDLLTLVVRPQATPLSALDRSIQAASTSHLAARRALAVAIAEEERETKRRSALAERISDLEQRAVEAIRGARDDLATSASETIAALETEVQSSGQASKCFAAEVVLARREVEAQRRRLADLDRGRRLARVGAALNGTAPNLAGPLMQTDVFAEAEETLSKIEAENHDARAIRLELAPPAERLIEQMSDLGFGTPIRVRPSDVMARLRGMAAAPAPFATAQS